MLVEQTLFGKVDRVAVAIERLRTFEPPEGYYVAFSGGKDSCVVLELVKRSGVKYDAHFNLTTVDPPELLAFIREHHADVEVHRPKESMWQLIVRKGMPPTQIARYCCEKLKETAGQGRFVATGIRWAESTRRSKRGMVDQCTKNAHRKTYLHPIIDWSDTDVWEYIHATPLPYCRLYDEGHTRIGCIMCPMATEAKRMADATHWPKYADAYRRAFGRMLKRNQEIGRETMWTNAEDVMHWWIHNPPKGDPDQCMMFED